MAKQFKIYFSKSKTKVTEIFDKKTGEEKVSVRVAEIQLLVTIFKVAARFQTDPGKSLECRDCVQQVDNIISSVKYVELTKDDIQFAKEGYAKLAGVLAYDSIDHSSSLLAQIDSPFDPETVVKWDDKLNKFKEA